MSASPRKIRPENIVDALDPLELRNRAPWSNVVCGLLVFFTHGVDQPLSDGADWNLFLTGMAIVFVAFASMIAHGNMRRNYWSALNVVAGLWLIVSTTLVLTSSSEIWTQICLGVLTVTIALTSLMNEHEISRSDGSR